MKNTKFDKVGAVRAIVVGTVLVMAVLSDVSARTFDFRAAGTKGASSGSSVWWGSTEKSKSAFFQIKVGSATKIDDRSEMEIRAATVFKSIRDRRTAVNDVAVFSFEPINTSKALWFMVATGTAYARTDNYFVDGAFDRGWQMAGCIIEIWQKGKVVKHWSNIPGNGGKTRLTNDVKQLRINAKGQECNGEYSVFDNATEICPVSQKGEKIDLEEVLAEYRDQNKPKTGTPTPDTSEKPAAKATNPQDFVIESFCGFKFGSPRPEFDQRIVKMQKPFRHYGYLRPTYGTASGKLVAVRLESRQAFAGADQRNEALLGVVAVLEKKYGIELKAEGGGDYYYFSNEKMHMWVTPNCIEVKRLDLQRMEEQQSRAVRDEIKKAMPAATADDGADVL